MPTNIDIFPWNDNFATGIATIDEQHRRLIELLNLLVNHMATQSEAPALNQVIQDLKDYAAVHFQTEEAIWHKHFQGDRWETWHQLAHTDFVEQVVRLKDEQATKPLDEVIEGIVTFLTHWLALHIIESDKRMAKVVLALPSGCSLEQAKKMADAEMSGATRTLIETVMTMYDKLANHTVRMTREIYKRKQTELALRQTQEELRATRDQAVAANLSKSEFLAMISHDLRTPLHGLLGYAELLTQAQVSDEERIDYASIILSSGQTLVTLVDDILHHARLEAGKLVLTWSDCDPAQLLAEVSAVFAKVAQSKGLAFDETWDGPPGPCYRIDPVRVRQMLSNLISNAIKFTQTGSISVRAQVSTTADGESVLVFSVADTGIGIQLADQQRLFRQFEQIDSATQQNGGGSGLGLYIVRELAELMGGQVGVDSQVGQGSRFWFSVKAQPVNQEMTHV